MLVKDIMSSPVISIKDKETVGKAMELMKSHKIRHLPVIDSCNKLIGIIAERDILKVFPRKKNLDKFQFNLLSRTPVTQIMSTDLLIVSSEETVESATSMMEKRDVGCIPVVDGCKLVGLISEVDIFNTFVKTMGIEKPGLRLTIKLQRNRGFLARLVEVFDSNQAIIDNLVTFPNTLVLKVQNGENEKLLDDLAANGFEVLHFAKDEVSIGGNEAKEDLKIGNTL